MSRRSNTSTDLDESLDIMSSGLGLTATLTQEKITTLIVHDNCIERGRSGALQENESMCDRGHLILQA